jgi:cholesterol 25-hydroxylase
MIPRTTIGLFIFTALFLPSIYESIIAHSYKYLYNSPWYNLSTFETLEILLLYITIEPIYTYRFANNPALRIDVRPHPEDNLAKPKLPRMRRPTKRLMEIVTFLLPLVTLDLILIKKYAGVGVSDIRQSGGYKPFPPSGPNYIKASFLAPTLHKFTWRSPLQLRRALPADTPSSRRIVLELLVAFFIYDALFFFIHIAFHRVSPLRRIHHPHHTHAEMNPQVTNRLSIIERVSLILLANFSLNIIGSHVLTRTLFVPLFVYLLIEVHCGMDLPWGYDKIMPFGLGAGSRKHAIHHRVGIGYYQPFFTWWDDALELIEMNLNVKREYIK